jgi:hypothetical protein
MGQAFDVFARGATDSLADERDGFNGGQENLGFEKWVGGCADGSLPEQIEKPLAQEDGLLSGDFFKSGGCDAIGSKSNFILDGTN